MEADTTRSFATEWPALEKQLTSMLARRRIPACLREDIVQETGLRLFRNWDRIDPERSVWPFALTIAVNLVRDEIRDRALMERKLTIAGDGPIPEDIEELALARIELERVAEALNRLTVAQRAALLAEVSYQTERVNTPAVKMLRMRARRRLKVMLEEVSAFLAPLGWSIRRTYRRFEESVAKFATDGISALSSAGVCLLCVAAALVPALNSPEVGAFGKGDSLAPEEYERQLASFGTSGRHTRGSVAGRSATSTAQRVAAAGATPSNHSQSQGQGGTGVSIGDDGFGVDEGENEVGTEGYRFSKGVRGRLAGQRVRVDIRSAYKPPQGNNGGIPKPKEARVPYTGVKTKVNGKTYEAGVGQKPDDN